MTGEGVGVIRSRVLEKIDWVQLNSLEVLRLVDYQ